MKTTLKLALFAALSLALCAPPPLTAAVTGRSADSSLAGTEKILSDSSGTDTYILLSTLWGSQTLTGTLTGTGAAAFDFSAASGVFKTPTGIATFGGSAHNFSSVLQPTTNDAAALGTSSLGFSDLFLANGGVINWNAGEVTITQAAGVITVGGSGAGDLRVTTAGTNTASVVTVGGTQTLTAKTATALVLADGLTASGSAANTFAGSTGTFLTSTGANTFKGSAHNFDALLRPTSDDGAALGDTTHGFSDIHLATGAVINVANGNAAITHSSGIFTVSTGDLRVTTAGTNAASVLTVDGVQTSSNKTFVAPVLGAATATSINGLIIDTTTGTFDLTNGKTLAVTGSLTLAGTDSTTMTFPATSSKVMSSSLSTNSIGIANSVWGASNALVWEGATADTEETSLIAVDPSADQSVSIPSFAVDYALLGSTLTTNTIDAANSIWGVSNALTFEGATADTSEGTLSWADVTADVTYLLPDAATGSYGIMLSTLATNAPAIANSVTGGTNQLIFEGTADAHEAIIDAADATADTIFRLPVAAAATYSIMSSTLATNAADIANSVYGVSNGLMFEGATADGSEAKITSADVTADVVLTIADAAAATYSIMTSTLTTNAPDIANSVTGTSNGIFFEGATADTSEIKLTATDATADVIYNFANAAAGTYGVMSTSLSTNQLDAANSVTGTSNGFVSEGATADTSETTLSFTDATADTTVTIPAKAVSGTVEVLSVQDEPATDTITAGQLYGGVITNTGAVGAAVYTLPAPAVGMHFRVYLTVAQDVDINPADGTTILALTNAAGDAISSAATIGNCIELVALTSTTWAAFAVSGTWSDAN